MSLPFICSSGFESLIGFMCSLGQISSISMPDFHCQYWLDRIFSQSPSAHFSPSRSNYNPTYPTASPYDCHRGSSALKFRPEHWVTEHPMSVLLILVIGHLLIVKHLQETSALTGGYSEEP